MKHIHIAASSYNSDAPDDIEPHFKTVAQYRISTPIISFIGQSTPLLTHLGQLQEIRPSSWTRYSPWNPTWH